MQFMIERVDIYAPARERLIGALQRSGTHQVLDLCSGAGGPWPHWLRTERASADVTLTDKYPNAATQSRLRACPVRGLRYLEQPIDATAVPEELPGFRTLFSSFHHFEPERARKILRDAVERRQPIAVLECTERHPLAPVAGLLFIPIIVWVMTLFMKSWTWRRVLWTYLLPAIPLLITIDGIVSYLRTYTIDELREMAGTAEDYEWLAGRVRSGRLPANVTYFIGYPTQHRS